MRVSCVSCVACCGDAVMRVVSCVARRTSAGLTSKQLCLRLGAFLLCSTLGVEQAAAQHGRFDGLKSGCCRLHINTCCKTKQDVTSCQDLDSCSTWRALCKSVL